MRQFTQHVVDFLKREHGPTAVEYAVMLALIIVVCITAITALGTNANKTFTTVGNAIGARQRQQQLQLAKRWRLRREGIFHVEAKLN